MRLFSFQKLNLKCKFFAAVISFSLLLFTNVAYSQSAVQGDENSYMPEQRPNLARCEPGADYREADAQCNRDFGVITAQQLSCWDNRSSINWVDSSGQQISGTRALAVATSEIESMAVNFFYQELADNSRAQAQCRTNVVNLYNDNMDQRARMDSAAREAFVRIQHDLTFLVEQRRAARASNEANQRQAMGDRGMSAALASGREQNNSTIEFVDQTLPNLIMAIPFGQEPEVKAAIEQMGETGEFDVSAYWRAVVASREKYTSAVRYFDEMQRGRPNYCIDHHFRRQAAESGQVQAWLNAMPANDNGERNLREHLRCRFQNRAALNRNLETAIGIGAALSWVTPFGGAVSQSARWLAALPRLNTSLNTLYLISTVSNIGRTCFGDEGGMVSSATTCNAGEIFNRTMVQGNTSQCAINGVGLAIGLPFWMRDAYRLSRAAEAAAVARPALNPSEEVTEVIVNGAQTRRLPALTSRPRQRVRERRAARVAARAQRRERRVARDTAQVQQPNSASQVRPASVIDEAASTPRWQQPETVDQVGSPGTELEFAL